MHIITTDDAAHYCPPDSLHHVMLQQPPCSTRTLNVKRSPTFDQNAQLRTNCFSAPVSALCAAAERVEHLGQLSLLCSTHTISPVSDFQPNHNSGSESDSLMQKTVPSALTRMQSDILTALDNAIKETQDLLKGPDFPESLVVFRKTVRGFCTYLTTPRTDLNANRDYNEVPVIRFVSLNLLDLNRTERQVAASAMPVYLAIREGLDHKLMKIRSNSVRVAARSLRVAARS